MPPPHASASLVESKAFGWLVENVSVWSICAVRSLLFPEPEPVVDVDERTGKRVALDAKVRRVLKNIAISYASSVAVEVGSVYALKIVDALFFQHVPHFARNLRRSDSPFTWRAFADWREGNFFLQSLAGGVALGLVESFMPPRFAQELRETPFSLARFLRNYAILRVAVDVTFYWAHRMLHVHPWIYARVHARHHQHYQTNLRTNFHFGAVDLFLESAVPIGVGLAVLRFLCGAKMSRFELHLMQGYVAWHESGTHMGKPLNLISTYAPLSVLYHAVLPEIDARAIEFHETHRAFRPDFGVVARGLTPLGRAQTTGASASAGVQSRLALHPRTDSRTSSVNYGITQCPLVGAGRRARPRLTRDDAGIDHLTGTRMFQSDILKAAAEATASVAVEGGAARVAAS